ncbi:hypothetical protein [Streptococcus hillyeri]|uniref:Uncharacterized protein n=1 Tax=Streptococcus hillyeri TaxID=2282420 RepID=A0A3L9DL46_9STRE|nr:hypothetical protein [Streptococcus hillyeri]RLY01725.1 hypothetical protein EAF07_09125 [Streptococcus hillyeri]
MKKQLTMLTVLATVIALGAYWGLSTLQISASETAVVQEAPQVAPMKTTDALVEVWKDRPIEELESYLAHIPNEVPVIAYPDEVGGGISAMCEGFDWHGESAGELRAEDGSLVYPDLAFESEYAATPVEIIEAVKEAQAQ